VRKAVPDTFFFERLSKPEMNELASINSFESSAFELLLFFLVVALVFLLVCYRGCPKKCPMTILTFQLLCIGSLRIYFKDIMQRFRHIDIDVEK